MVWNYLKKKFSSVVKSILRPSFPASLRRRWRASSPVVYAENGNEGECEPRSTYRTEADI